MPLVRQGKDYSYVDEWRSMWEPDLKALAYNGQTCDPTRVDPKVLHWIKENCAHKPHFIKVINDQAAAACGWKGHQGRRQHRLGVPRPFMREHFRELERVVTLESGQNKKWKVSFGVARKNSAWMQGWGRFARENHLKSGDVMIFVLVGNSHFHFTLFDEHGNIHKSSTSTPTLINVDATIVVKKEPITAADQEQYLQKKKRRILVKDEPRVILQPSRHGHVAARSQAPTSDRNVTELSPGRFGAELEECPTGSLANEKTSDLEEHELAIELHSSGSEISLDIHKPSTKKPWPVVKVEMYCSTENAGIISHKSSPVAVQQGTNPPYDPFNPLAFFIRSRRRTTSAFERKRAKDVAKAHAEVLNGFRFLVVMSEAHVYRDFHLQVPDRFVSESDFPTAWTRWRLVDTTGKAWQMCSQRNTCNQVAFHRKYWSVFALHHFLEEGDTCVFQLKADTRVDAMTLLVRIFRVVQLPKAHGRNIITVHDHYDLRLRTKSHISIQC